MTLGDEQESTTRVFIVIAATVVILSAIGVYFGVFFHTLGTSRVAHAPQAGLSYNFSADNSTGPLTGNESAPATGTLTIVCTETDAIPLSELRVIDQDGNSIPGVEIWSGDTLDAGETGNVAIDSTDVVRVIWEKPDGSNSATLGKYQGPHREEES